MDMSGQKAFVTLYVNDGMLETSTARPFVVDVNMTMKQIANECHKRLYDMECGTAKVFTTLGVELDDPVYIPSHQSLVVSNGSAMVPVKYSNKMPEEELNQFPDIDSVLRGIYNDRRNSTEDLMDTEALESVIASAGNTYIGAKAAAGGRAPAGGFSPNIDNVLSDLLSPVEPTPQAAQSAPLQSIFNNIQFPTLSMQQVTSAWGDGNLERTKFMNQSAPVHQMPTPQIQQPQPPQQLRQPPVLPKVQPKLSPRESIASPEHMVPIQSPDSTSVKNEAFETVPSPSNSVQSTSSGGTQRRTSLVNRAESHKASEQRSRQKLKECIEELVLSVPTLKEHKAPTKATIIKKATEYVQHSSKQNEKLKQENEALQKEIADLHLRSSKVQTQLQIANIMTVEIVDMDMRYIFVDHMWEIVMGFGRGEVVGKFIKEVTGCAQCPLMAVRCVEIMKNIAAGQAWHGVVLSRRRDGRAFACEAEISPIIDSQGKVFQHVCTRRNFHMLSQTEKEKLCIQDASTDLYANGIANVNAQALVQAELLSKQLGSESSA
eukprot:Nk52_evm29s2309 gene=Nk52_evmTU29s2309